MKKAKEISIKEYPSNIEVFVHEPEELIGRALSITCDSDRIPSASYVPTIQAIQEDSNNILTLAQCKEIKSCIWLHCQHWFK